VVAVLAGLALMASAHAQQMQISISTGGTGGVWYPMGGAMANVLSKYMPNTAATAEVTGASVDNLRLIGARKTDLGFSMVDTAWDAMNGNGKFKDGKSAFNTTVPPAYPDMIKTLQEKGVNITVKDTSGTGYGAMPINFLPLILPGPPWSFMIRQISCQRGSRGVKNPWSWRKISSSQSR
jgi:hypothetical protein